MISFIIQGNPVPQGRPRFVRIGKGVRTYDPPKSRLWKECVRLQAKAKGIKPIEGAIKIELTFVCEKPKKPVNSYPRGDLDNFVKGLKDSLNGIAYKDDSQIVRLIASKEYEEDDGYKPCVLVRIEQI